jgi:hypothetical protein
VEKKRKLINCHKASACGKKEKINQLPHGFSLWKKGKKEINQLPHGFSLWEKGK